MIARRAGALLLAAMLALGPAAAAPLRPAPAPQAVFPYGVSWYPEQFPESDWDGELALMARANISYVRVAEFSWAVLEPAEGRYDFGWLDRAIAAAAKHNIRVMIGTPTAAPPAWLTTRYPDVLAVEADGRTARHGWRRQYSVGSARYRTLAADIAGRLAQRYGRNPAVIGFQIDNEYGRETYDAETTGRFQQWLRARYGTIDHYNDVQFNRYWSLTYDDWSQIRIPAGAREQPGLWIDWLRAFSDMWRDYQQAQIDAMRPHLAPDKIITTNYVAKYDEFDFSVPAQALDVVGWDWYFEEPLLNPAEGAMLHDLYRGFLGRNPWVMEAAPGHMNWADRNYVQPKGELRAMVWQAVAHGADSFSFWVWRSPLNGTETNHGSLLDAGGRPKPVYAEIAQTGGELATAWPALRGSAPVADVAMLYDYPSRWAVERQPMTKDYDVWRAFVRMRSALAPVSRGVDVLRDPASIGRYRLVVAPNLHLLDAATARRLARYVQDGGHLLIGPRAGVKDENGRLLQPGQLGPLEALLGARIDLAEALPAAVSLAGSIGSGTATIWAERVTPTAPDVQPLLRYGKSDGWLDGAPAVVTRRVGKGRITYLGAWLDDAALAALLRWSAAQSQVEPLWPGIPEGVEVDARQVGNRTTFVAINWSEAPRTLTLPRPMHDLLAGGTVGAATLPRFGVAVLGEVR